MMLNCTTVTMPRIPLTEAIRFITVRQIVVEYGDPRLFHEAHYTKPVIVCQFTTASNVFSYLSLTYMLTAKPHYSYRSLAEFLACLPRGWHRYLWLAAGIEAHFNRSNLPPVLAVGDINL